MSGKRLNKSHPDYEEFCRLADEAVAERMDSYSKIYDDYTRSEDPNRMDMLSEVKRIDKKCNSTIKELMTRFEHLYDIEE